MSAKPLNLFKKPFEPLTADQILAMETCPYHLITEGHPTDMELAAKCGVDYTDAEIETMAKTLKHMDLYWMYFRACIENAPAKFFARWHRLSHAYKKVGK